MLLGAADSTSALLTNEKSDRIAFTVTDIVTQYQTIKIADLSDILKAASQLMQPFPFGNKGIVIVTSVYKAAGDNPRICWQYSGGGTLGTGGSKIGTDNGNADCTKGSYATLPNGLTMNDNENLIISEVFYAFTPMFMDFGLLKANTIYRTAVYKPRLSPLITRPS